MSRRKAETRSKKSIEAQESAGNKRIVYLYGAAALLALLGLCDAIYLTVKHYTGGIVPCSLTNGCETVLTSEYATLWGIPLALLGALAYFTVFSLATLAAFGSEPSRKLLFYLVLLMLAFTIWLFILQAFVIHAFCQFCLLSAGITLSLAAIVITGRVHPKFK